MATQTAYPTTVVNQTGIGTVAWTTLHATADDGNNATVSLGGGQISNYLKSSGYGFSIPGGATINGITAEYEILPQGVTVKDHAVRLVRADGTIGNTDKSDVSNWPTGSATILTRGGASDLWGETLTPADVNDADFGLALSAERVGGMSPSAAAAVDFFRLTVHYTAGPTAELESVTPGTAHPADTVTLAGSGFTGATAVQFSGASAALVDATSFEVISDTEIEAVIPNNPSAGPNSVKVVTPGGELDLTGSPLTISYWAVRLNWEHADAADLSFDIQKLYDMTGLGGLAGGHSVTGVTTFLDTTVQPGYSYRYTITARRRTDDNAHDLSSSKITTEVITIPGTLPDLTYPTAATDATAELE